MSRLPLPTDALSAFLRNEFEVHEPMAGAETLRSATDRLPPHSVLRRYKISANTNMEDADNIQLVIACGDAASPTAADFIGRQRLIPRIGESNSAPRFSPEGELEAQWRTINLYLGPRPCRLMYEMTNSNTMPVVVKIRFLIDGLGQLGLPDGSR